MNRTTSRETIDAMRIALLVLGLLVAFGLIGVGVHLYMSKKDEDAKATAKAAAENEARDREIDKAMEIRRITESADVKTTPKQMAADYAGNEVAADATYKSKIVELDGIVDHVQKMRDGVLLYFVGDAVCAFVHDDPTLVEIKRGQRILVHGVGAGMARDRSGPVLMTCVITATWGER